MLREFEQFRMLVFGAAMVVIMIWRPRGLVATRDPSLYLSDFKKGGVSDIPSALRKLARLSAMAPRKHLASLMKVLECKL